jgi:hypothetical protein
MKTKLASTNERPTLHFPPDYTLALEPRRIGLEPSARQVRQNASAQRKFRRGKAAIGFDRNGPLRRHAGFAALSSSIFLAPMVTGLPLRLQQKKI